MIKKNSKIALRRDIDCRNNGGPLMKAGTKGIVLLKKRDGTLWVDLDSFGFRHVYIADVDEMAG